MRNTKLYLFTLLLLSFYSLSHAGKIKVNTTHEIVTLNQKDGPVALVESILMKFKETAVFIGKSDSTFWNWEVKGDHVDGYIELFVSEERGVGWDFYMGRDTLKVLISTDYKNTNDPRLLSLTGTIDGSLYYIENQEPDCNSKFQVYELVNPEDSDVEYTGDYALEIETNLPCANGKWKVKSGKQIISYKIQAAAIFTGMMVQNVRHLLKYFVLEE